MKIHPRVTGFSLVEVVLALGVISFAGMALLGLFSVGLSTNRESFEELEATHAAYALLAQRRSAPVAVGNYVLPALNEEDGVSKDTPVLLNEWGQIARDEREAKFNMIYRISPSSDGKASGVYICLFWPPQQTLDKAAGRYESYSVFSLP